MVYCVAGSSLLVLLLSWLWLCLLAFVSRLRLLRTRGDHTQRGDVGEHTGDAVSA